MNTKAIEMMAVNRLKNELLLTGHLIPEIPDNDRSPSWDGEIIAYSDNSDRKDKMIGKVRVQVKGQYSSSPKGKKRSFRLERSDLINFKNDGGAILFVVYLKEDYEQYFCNDLTAEKIKYYLKQNQGKKSKKISIPISPMPHDPDELTGFVVNTINHCRMQTSFASQPIQTIKDFESRPDFEALQLKFFGIKNRNPVELLLNDTPKYWYGKTRNSAVPIPLEYQEIIDSIITEEVSAVISINNKEYYRSFRRVYTKTEIRCVIGNSFIILHNRKDNDTSISISLSDELHERAKDTCFIVDAFKNQSFEIENVSFRLDIVNPKVPDTVMNHWTEQKVWCNEAVKTLEMLHCQKNLFISELDNADLGNLNCLIEGIYKKNNRLKLNKNFADISFMQIGDLHILLHKIVDPDTGLYSIQDFYTSDIQMAVSADEIDYKITSQFDICDIDVLQKSDNLYLPSLFPDYKRFGFIEHIVTSANNMLLSLISLYDQTGDEQFLLTAKDFADWLMDAPDEMLDKYTRLLNLLQIEKRVHPLLEEQRSTLYNIIDDHSAALHYKVAAHALLEDYPAVRHYFEKLSDKEKENLIGHPIEKMLKLNESE